MGLQERPSRTEQFIDDALACYGFKLADPLRAGLRKVSGLVHGNAPATVPESDEGDEAMFLGGVEVLGQAVVGAKERIRKVLSLGAPESTPRPWNRRQDC